MLQLQFESLMQSLLRLPDVIQSIPDVLANPAANPLQAVILLGILFVVVLIVLVSVLLAVMGSSLEDEELDDEDGVIDAAAVDEAAAEQPGPLSWLTVGSIIVLVVAMLWVVTGVTTASSEVCISCHASSRHNLAAAGSDPHSGVGCVLCHETGGPVARATANLPVRVQHVIFGRTGSSLALAYGRPVASDSCQRCHHKAIQGVITNLDDGVRMSHKEPLAAGAQCVDCHVLASGVVGASTIGMTPCLRCHEGMIAKADCKACHVGDPADAIRSTAASASMASALVPNPQCNACHFDMTKCNACHGLGMPHSEVFKQYAHARPGALDIWYNNGKTCAKCHYVGHNDCLQPGCHTFPIAGGHPNPAWATMHQLAPWSGSEMACSCHQWNPFDHAGMNYCQICHPVKPKKAMP